VHVFRSREVTIGADRPFAMYADGDPIGQLPLRVRSVAGAIEVLVPADGGSEGFAGIAAVAAEAR
jgi:diacylglycerol kinase family enzyme